MNSAKGTFSPTRGVIPDPNEPDWIPPTDIPTEEEIEHSQVIDSGSPSSFVVPSANRKARLVGGDSISQALVAILGDLEKEIRRLNAEGADLFGRSQYVEAAKTAENGKLLQIFRDKVLGLKSEWLSVGSAKARGASIQSAQAMGNSTRRVPKKLTVVFDDGEIIEEDTAARTFAKCISRIGVERIKSLGTLLNGRPLLLETAGRDRSPVDGYFFDTRTTAQEKRKLLATIGEVTGVGLKVMISE